MVPASAVISMTVAVACQHFEGVLRLVLVNSVQALMTAGADGVGMLVELQHASVCSHILSKQRTRSACASWAACCAVEAASANPAASATAATKCSTRLCRQQPQCQSNVLPHRLGVACFEVEVEHHCSTGMSLMQSLITHAICRNE